jgi:undecaprenyl-diphosphatase
MMHHILHWDSALFLIINRGMANRVMDILFITITNGRFWIIPGIAGALVFLSIAKKQGLIVLGLALVTVALTDQLATDLVKPLVHRLRPCNPHVLLEGGRFLIGLKSSYSFPSNHAMNMFGQAMLLTFFYPRFAVWFFSFAGIIGFSRIYVGVHYPLDVIGGGLLGMACAVAVWAAWRFAVRRFKSGRTRKTEAGLSRVPD